MKKLALFTFVTSFGIVFKFVYDTVKHLTQILTSDDRFDYDPWNEYSSEEDEHRTPQTTTTASSGTTQPNNTERKSP